MAEAERELFAELFDEVENYAGITATFERARKEERIFALAHEGEVSFQRAASLARRYAAEKALAVLADYNRRSACGHSTTLQLACIHYGGQRMCRKALREALEKERGNA